MMNEIDITIIIPVLNQFKKLELCLRSLSKQLEGISNIEVIVVDNGSTDGSQNLGDKFGFSGYVSTDLKSPYAARNYGAQMSKSDNLTFLDAKCIPNEGYIQSLITICKRKDWELISGDFDFVGLTEDSSISELAYSIIYLKTNPKYNGGDVCTLTGNMIVKRSVFLDLGGFDESRSGGDVRFSQKATERGKVKLFIPELKVGYEPKRYKDLVASIKRVSLDLPNKVPILSVRPPSRKYIDSRLDDLNIGLPTFKRIKLISFIWYLRFLKYYYQFQ